MKSGNLVLGITGSIAAYKIPHFVRLLITEGYTVKVVLTEGGKAFVTPLTLHTLTGEPPYEGLFETDSENSLDHIQLARWADFILIAPCTAHFMAKLAAGLADDLLSTICLATQSPLILAPAMNQQMWLNPATQNNVHILKQRGITFWGPEEGLQACQETGPGRLSEPEDLLDKVNRFFQKGLLAGKRVLITAGPTQEPLDPVRFLTNRSSGKMGYALAEAALAQGAEVILISGPVALLPPTGCQFVSVQSAREMASAVQDNVKNMDIFIGTAAVSDYYLPEVPQHKRKKHGSSLTISLEPTPDILHQIGHLETGRPALVVGFAAETQDIGFLGEQKRQRKLADWIIVNDVSNHQIGFNSDSNAVLVLTDKFCANLPSMSKKQLAQLLMEMMIDYTIVLKKNSN